jgi:hypothetical protein
VFGYALLATTAANPSIPYGVSLPTRAAPPQAQRGTQSMGRVALQQFACCCQCCYCRCWLPTSTTCVTCQGKPRGLQVSQHRLLISHDRPGLAMRAP